MSARVFRLLKVGAGWAFLVLGVLGLFLPILQGVLFLAIGLSILATEQAWARRVLHWLRRRFPRLAHSLDQGGQRARDWISRHFRGGRP